MNSFLLRLSLNFTHFVRSRMEGLIKINFPVDKLKIRADNGSSQVFDVIRRIWIPLTPEEWVRQHFIQYLLSIGYPASLIAVEKQIIVGELTKRCDLVVYSRDAKPFMIIECKQMNVPLSQEVLEQALRYHIALQPSHLIITNGSFTMGFRKEAERFVPAMEFPSYE